MLTESGDFLVWEYIDVASDEVLITESGDNLVQENGGLLLLAFTTLVGGNILVEIGSFTATAIDPQVMLRWSDDGGHTWSSERWTSMGKIGEFGYRTFWRRLGSSRDRVYEVSGTDPVKIAIMGAELHASPTNA